MANKRAASKENQHPVVKKLKNDTPAKESPKKAGRKPKSEGKICFLINKYLLLILLFKCQV